MIDSTHTRTAEGRIKHLEVCTDHGIVRAPVKVVGFDRETHRPLPKRTPSGGYVYALPGGEEYVP